MQTCLLLLASAVMPTAACTQIKTLTVPVDPESDQWEALAFKTFQKQLVEFRNTPNRGVQWKGHADELIYHLTNTDGCVFNYAEKDSKIIGCVAYYKPATQDCEYDSYRHSVRCMFDDHEYLWQNPKAYSQTILSLDLMDIALRKMKDDQITSALMKLPDLEYSNWLAKHLPKLYGTKSAQGFKKVGNICGYTFTLNVSKANHINSKHRIILLDEIREKEQERAKNKKAAAESEMREQTRDLRSRYWDHDDDSDNTDRFFSPWTEMQYGRIRQRRSWAKPAPNTISKAKGAKKESWCTRACDTVKGWFSRPKKVYPTDI